MGKKMEWDEFKKDWRKAAILPDRYEARALCSLSKSAVEKEAKMNELLDADYSMSAYIQSVKTFKQAS